MSNCISIVNDLDEQDQITLVGKVDAFIGEGMPPKQAQLAAVDAMLAEIDGVQSSAKDYQANFEVAPDPNDEALSSEWNALSLPAKQRISRAVAKSIVPQVLKQYNATGDIVEQTGSYMDDTNPSFALQTDSPFIDEISKVLGYILSQDSMANFSALPFPGSEKAQAVVIELGDKTFDEIQTIYNTIRAKVPQVSGQSYAGGNMTILNVVDWTGINTDDLMAQVDNALDGVYDIANKDFYYSFPEKKDYNYDNREETESGSGSGVAESIRKASRSLRSEASTKIKDYIQREKAGEEVRSSAKDLGFYSELSKQIASNPTKQAPAAQWQQYIKSLITKGVKPDEIEWSGIIDFLGLQEGKVTKDQILDYLNANGVQIEETVLDSNADEELYEGPIEEDGEYVVYTLSDDEVARFDSIEDARDYISKSQASDRSTRYDRYKLDGGENYREVLLTLPTGGPSDVNKLSDAELRVLILRNDSNADVDDLERSVLLEIISGMDMTDSDISKLTGENAARYMSSHWDQPNVLAHLRVDDRVDADGNKTLFVQEIQSDFAQDKRNGKDVPDAPFIDTTDKWLTLALKRVMTIAVSSGYDKVAFINGEQSADRYDLSKQIDHIEYRVSGDNNYIVHVYAKNGDLVRTPPSLDADGLEEHVGKELANKIVETAGVELKHLENLDLKVGGEGMKIFYDAIVPNAIKSLLKKLGGGQLEVSVITKPNTTKPIQDFLGRWKALSHPENTVVNDRVMSASNNNQVVEAIVKLIPVNVVDMLSLKDIRPDDFTRNPEMFFDRFPFDMHLPIAEGFFSALSKVGALLRAGLNSAYEAGLDKEILPALYASDFSLNEGLGILGFSNSNKSLSGGYSNIRSSAASTGFGAKPSRVSLGHGGGELRPAELTKFVNWHNSISSHLNSDKAIVQPSFEITDKMREKVSGGLPLFSKKDLDAAEKAGFDTKTYYHGTTKEFKGFKVGRNGFDELGAGVYVTDRPEYAEAWASADGGRLIPVLIKKGDIYDYGQKMDHIALANRIKSMNPINESEMQARDIRKFKEPTEWTDEEKKIVNDASQELWRSWLFESAEDFADYIKRTPNNVWLQRAGYIGAKNDNSQIPGQVVVFEPKNLRSPWAKFNTKKAESANLLHSKKDVFDTWSKYSEQENGFKFGKTPNMRSKRLDVIAEEFSTPDLSISVSDTPMMENWHQIIVNGDQDLGNMTLKYDANSRRYHIDASDAAPRLSLSIENQGQRMYQVLFAFAHNNKLVVDSDFSITPVNEVRRNTSMLSSALRFGSTEHFGELTDEQGVDGWIDDASSKSVFENNVTALAIAELRKVEQRVKRFSQLRIDHTTGSVYYAPVKTDTQTASVDGRDAIDEQRTGGTINPRQNGMEPVDSENGSRRSNGGTQDNGYASTRGGEAVGDGASIQGKVVTDTQLRDHLASTGGGFALHGVGVATLKRALITKQALENGAIEDVGIDGLLNSSKDIIGKTARQYTPEQLRAFANVGFEKDVPSLKERAQELWKDAGKKLAQGIVDQFAPIKDLDLKAYGLMRLAKGASGAFETILRGGKLKLTDGVYDFDETNKGGVVDKLLTPMQGEHHDFLRWVAANRAERLMGEDREHLFSDQDIIDIKTLEGGDLDFDYTLKNGPNQGQVTRIRSEMYKDSLITFNEFNTNVMDMAEQSGLIDGQARQYWEHEFYVPFYRVSDEEGFVGAKIKGGVVRQQAFKKLKGGKDKLNTDLLDNTLMNWAHLLDAAAKNRAAKASLEAAESMGVALSAPEETARQIGKATGNKNGVVWFMDGGKEHYFVVDDPFILTAITSLEYAGMRNPAMNALSAMKHMLTVGVTASPFFKVRNLIRDSIQVIGTGPISYNPIKNVVDGWKMSNPKNDLYFRLLAGGGTIHFGTMLEGTEAKRVQALVESGVHESTILGDEHKVKAFYRKYIEPSITAYNELGNKGEMVNRASLYDQLVKQGMSHAEASLQARDLMDFSMQGAWTGVRFLTQIVPFLNARLQGMYKLGRGAKEDPRRMAYVTGAVALASLGLLAAYGDDDDWKKRESWDRDNYWWFKIGGIAFRIPKPFEIGAIGTLAERSAEVLFTDDLTGKQFGESILKLLGDNLSMNPVPQLIKPMIDIYANKDSFSGRPIESMSMERLKSDYRFNGNTSMTARALSTSANAVTGLVGKETLSPVQIDHLIKGYFGWLGTFIVGSADIPARWASDQPDKPASDLWRMASGGMISQLEDAPSKYVSAVYEQAKVIDEAYGTWRALLKEGKIEEANEFRDENLDKIKAHGSVQAIKGALTKINQRIRAIERSDMDSDAKREEIRRLNVRKDQFARRLTAKVG